MIVVHSQITSSDETSSIKRIGITQLNRTNRVAKNKSDDVTTTIYKYLKNVTIICFD